ncbi:hypothetical protein [Kineococcus aurantiacus]|uniref:Uncharacterized protein n=1 Tax=Kineococcus aurantiacus TaxID=37633 RepID=A0A7Y9DPU8_9ACTN|nr:hypothetical protein [Kineococcus aurantiacus]NYD24595.1 hypothetical protein [Kineococcus aurantiacus]
MSATPEPGLPEPGLPEPGLPERQDTERAARRAALLAARHAAWVRRRVRGFQPRRLPVPPTSGTRPARPGRDED